MGMSMYMYANIHMNECKHAHIHVQTDDRYIPLSIILIPHTLSAERINKSTKAYEVLFKTHKET